MCSAFWVDAETCENRGRVEVLGAAWFFGADVTNFWALFGPHGREKEVKCYCDRGVGL